MEAVERRKKALEALGVTSERPRTAHSGPYGARLRRGGYGKCPRPRKTGTKLMENEIGKRHMAWNMCGKKKRYRSQAEAHRMANAAFARRGTRLHCYFCGLCHGYHLTKRTQSNSNAGRVF